ncbi:hypothetical protein CLV73_1975 [Chryseobacterium geocarposphaerae]|uniref:Uncharacterized protein n=1 Tax=Chryseobacterium geocarposphaerae TaxID=1416776 RepID=A0A2M9CAS6_9FLAO|nr:hypothetical protein CLV73_1975 [Chryseobacterium geocarposphaerae]
MNLIQNNNEYFDYFSTFKSKLNKLNNKQTFNYKNYIPNKSKHKIYHNYYLKHNILDLVSRIQFLDKIFCYFCAINF